MDSYQLINYETTRKRNGDVVKWYSRRQHNINKYSLNLIKSDEFPLTDEIKKEVLEKYLSKYKKSSIYMLQKALQKDKNKL